MQGVRIFHSYETGRDDSLTPGALSLDHMLELHGAIQQNNTAIWTPCPEILIPQVWRWVPKCWWFFSQASQVGLMNSQGGDPRFSGEGLISGVRDPPSKSQLQTSHMTLSHLGKFSAPSFPYL